MIAKLSSFSTPRGVVTTFISDFGLIDVTPYAYRFSVGPVGNFHGGQEAYLQKWAKFQILFKGVK